MHRRTLAVTLGLLTIGIGWYLSRPELLFANRSVNEEFSGGTPSPVVLFEGRFHSVAHEGRGLATIYQLPQGERVLRFTEFETSNGPDLYVYLVAANDAHDSATVKRAGFVSLGPLKAKTGNQNYNLPPDLDLTEYRSVSIWCRPFGVNFATAPLAPRETK